MIPGGGSPLHTLSQVIWLLHPNEGKLQSGFPPQRGWDRVSTIGGWNIALPSEDGTVFLPAPLEHRTTLPLLYTMETGFLPLGDGTRFPLHHQRMEHGSIPLPQEDGTGFPRQLRSLSHSSIEGWNSVSTPPYRDRAGFCSTTGDWKDILGMGLPPLKNGTGFPLSEDGTGILRHY
jgi:hypothetical protein